MGVGNFLGMLPEEMRESRLYGVELDSISGRIARKLYPNADVTVGGFETTDQRDFYDLAIGNVPFGNYRVADKPYDKLGFTIHNYFFAKALDQVRPGGVVAFVTSRYTMDQQSPDVRKYLAERAELLGAIRLPNNAFRANAGTDVVSDIIFLQKRDRPIDIEPDWVHLGLTPDGFPINSYFAEHPEMVLGEISSESTQFRLEDQLLKYFPAQIEKTHGIIRGLEADAKTAALHPLIKDGFTGMTVGSMTFDKKEDAGAAILAACKEYKGHDPMEIGSYRGFKMLLSYDSFDNAYQLSLKGEMNHYVTLGTDARGNLTRIDNALGGIEGRIETTKQKLDSLYQQQEDAKAELGKPFPQEAELQQKSARLAELDAALNMDEHETVGAIEDDETEMEADGVSMVAEKSSVMEYLKNPPECVSSGRQRKHEEEVL